MRLILNDLLLKEGEISDGREKEMFGGIWTLGESLTRTTV